jgi:uncharacterized membrane protein YjfL (UPF0719 family)
VLSLNPGFWSGIGNGLGAIVLYAILGLLLMILGYYAIDLTTPGPLTQLVRSGHPNAVTVSAAGLVSMALIVVVAIYHSSGRLGEGLLSALIFGFVGIIVQAIAVRVLEWVGRIDIGGLLKAEKFTPVSLFVAAAHLALGLVVAFSIS